MQATIGDRICIHGSIVGHPDKNGEIVEVHGDGGTPPYLVKFDDGKTRLIYPGPDAVIEPPRPERRPRGLAIAPLGAALGRERGHALGGVLAGHEVVEGRARVLDGLDDVGDTAGLLHDPQ
jgi:hypothetical protein